MKRDKLIAARYRNGMSQEEVAEHVGVTRNTLSLWERGITTPYPAHVRNLCEVYKTDAEGLGLTNQSRLSSQTEDFSGVEFFPVYKTQPECTSEEERYFSLLQRSTINLEVITQQFREIQRTPRIPSSQA